MILQVHDNDVAWKLGSGVEPVDVRTPLLNSIPSIDTLLNSLKDAVGDRD